MPQQLADWQHWWINWWTGHPVLWWGCVVVAVLVIIMDRRLRR